MSDIIDNANDAADQFTRQAIEAARSPEPHQVSRSHCLDCEELISEERRKKVPGCHRCVLCQEEFETITSHWRPI